MNIRKLALASAAVSTLALAISGTANAALVSCPDSFTADGTAKVYNGGSSAASACQYQTPPDNNIVANATNVNAAGFFGFTDWELAPGAANQLDVNAASGSWSIPGADFAAYDYMITFKDGKGTNLISFLFNELFGSGSWNSPFTNEAFADLNPGQVKEVSHFSIFRRSNPTEVPEPATLGLLGLGLLGLRLMRRRSRA